MNQEKRDGGTPFPFSDRLTERLWEICRQDWDSPLFRNYAALRKLGGYLKKTEEQGRWAPEIEAGVILILEEYGLLAAERLIERWLDPDYDLEIDFSEYSELVGKAYERFGKPVGTYFNFSYKPAIMQGLSGQEYFDLVAQAVEDQGRLVARWFAYGLPEVLAVEGNPHEYRKALKQVHQAGRTKIMKSYAHQAPRLEAYDFTLSESADYVVETIDQLGEELGFWVVRHMSTVNELGYHPYLFLEDTRRFLEERGEKAARWYASGFAGFYTALRYLDKLGKGKTLLDPRAYKEEYLRLLATIGQGGATFFARCMGGLREDAWETIKRDKEMVDLRCFADEIISFKEKVSKEVFNQAIWFLPKIGSRERFGEYGFNMGINRLRLFLGEIIKVYEEEGEEITINAIRYTYGIRRRGGYPRHIVDPKKVIPKPPWSPWPDEEYLDDEYPEEDFPYEEYLWILEQEEREDEDSLSS